MRFMHSISNNRWKNAIDFQLRRYNFGNTLHSVGGTACYFNGVFSFHFVCDREHTPHHTNFACVIVFWFDLISSSSSSSIFGVFLSNVVELCVLAVNFRRFDRINFRNCLTCVYVYRLRCECFHVTQLNREKTNEVTYKINNIKEKNSWHEIVVNCNQWTFELKNCVSSSSSSRQNQLGFRCFRC